jgi:hypothetical protein
MAIFWCDPYIESPSGGVHGTTGVGTLGSYANPYSIDSMPPNMSGAYTNGDEIRLKALPANPWLTDSLLAWSPSFTIGSTFGVYFASFPNQHSFIKYTSIKGEKTYLSWNTPSRNTSQSAPPVWGGMSPYADVTLPAYKLDPQYYLSNLVTPSQGYMLQGQSGASTTLTAGWVSETARGGETIIHRVNPTAGTENWFGHGGFSHSTAMTVDAPELTISHSTTSNSMHINIYGRTVEVHDIIERSGYGTSCSVKIYTWETFKANSVASAGYIYMYGPFFNTTASQGINRDIKHLTAAYQLYIQSQGAGVGVNLKFKNLSCYILQCGVTTTFSYYDDFFFWTNAIQGYSQNRPTEMTVDPAVNIATVFEFKGPMSSLAPQLTYGNNNSDYRNYNAAPIKLTGGYLTNGATIDISRGDIYFRDFVLPTGGTLENVTSHSVVSSTEPGSTQVYQAFFGKAWCVDRNSGRRLAFSRVGGGFGVRGQLMMMYNSTEFNNKLVYHIMPNPSGVKSYDTVYIDMPTGVSEIAINTTHKLKFTLGGPVSAPVKLKPYLDGNNTTSTWDLAQAGGEISIPSGGQAGTVIYGGSFNSGSSGASSLVSRQQLVCILELYQPSYGVAKICIDSIELEVV